jgi:hypothetical protein
VHASNTLLRKVSALRIFLCHETHQQLTCINIYCSPDIAPPPSALIFVSSTATISLGLASTFIVICSSFPIQSLTAHGFME